MSSIITKLESGNIEKRAGNEHEVDSGNDGNLTSLDIFKLLLPKETMEKLANTKIKE